MAPMKLINRETGAEVQVGDVLLDFRGDPHTVEGWNSPHKPSSSGRINTDQGSFYPGVVNCEFRPRTDRGE